MVIQIALHERHLRDLQRALFDDSPAAGVLRRAVIEAGPDAGDIARITCSPAEAEGVLAAAEAYCKDAVEAVD
jgi:hypothetical protein